MASDDGDTNRFSDGDRESKGLWVAMDLLEERLECKMNQNTGPLTKEIQQMFADHLHGDSVISNPHQD